MFSISTQTVVASLQSRRAPIVPDRGCPSRSALVGSPGSEPPRVVDRRIAAPEDGRGPDRGRARQASPHAAGGGVLNPSEFSCELLSAALSAFIGVHSRLPFLFSNSKFR